MTAAESLRLLPPIFLASAAQLVGRLRLGLGLHSRRLARLDLESFSRPESSLVRVAAQECRERGSPEVVGHSHRTFLFGLALARRAGARPGGARRAGGILQPALAAFADA